MDNIFENIKSHLPPYLSPKQKAHLYEELRNFPNSIKFYIKLQHEGILQGDAWTGFTVVDFLTHLSKPVKAIVLSNTCDIDPNNKRAHPPKIIFSPLIKLNSYINKLHEAKFSSVEIENKINSIKKQEVTSVFYLPSGNELAEDYIVLLDDLHSMPFKIFHDSPASKIFTLSQTAFYLFILKLSIHFCRFNDGVTRTATVA